MIRLGASQKRIIYRMKKVRKAVFPVAGLGTRFLPATKAIPKEMLTVVDRPVIQYVVDECAAAGADDVLLVTSRDKKALEDHFDRSPELEARLASGGKQALLASGVAASPPPTTAR